MKKKHKYLLITDWSQGFFNTKVNDYVIPVLNEEGKSTGASFVEEEYYQISMAAIEEDIQTDQELAYHKMQE